MERKISWEVRKYRSIIAKTIAAVNAAPMMLANSSLLMSDFLTLMREC